jgi:hypothetical protein
LFPGNCFRCGQLGHIASECDELRPAQTRAEHLARLAEYQQRFQNWLEGIPGVKWTPEEKTRAITEENRLWAARAKEMAKAK